MTTRVRATVNHLDQPMVSERLRPRQYWRTLSPLELVLLCREALELLAMLAVVDPVSWQQLLLGRCGCENHKFRDDRALPPRFWVKLGNSKANGDELDTEYYRENFVDTDEPPQDFGSVELKKGAAILLDRFVPEGEVSVVAIIGVLVARDPAKMLLDGQEGYSGDDGDPGLASLKAGTTITIKPVDDETQLGSDPESLVLNKTDSFA